ncbi:MAG: DCC1-like thiol-disulfide oxidoreductase family protein [Polyangia bacterium]|jgi:predicted DCC family thiol-disulfide oxidoreductase YuxK
MSSDIRVARPPPRPVLIFDGECRFCSLWIQRWRQMTGDVIDYLPARDASIGARFPEIPAAAFAQAVQLVDSDGRVYAAAEAVLRTLARAGRWRWLLRLYHASSLFARTAEAGYRLIAGHRDFFARMARRL